MYEELNDRQLLDNLSKGCAVSFDEIYNRYSKPIYLYLLSKLGDPELCNDAAQDIFVNLWERRRTIRIEKSFSAYLYQAARFKIIDIYRSNVRYKHSMDELSKILEQYTQDNSATLDHKIRLRIVLNKIDHLPERMRQVFVASRFEYLTIKQIASKYNLSTQTVKNQLSKALEILRVYHYLLLIFVYFFNKN